MKAIEREAVLGVVEILDQVSQVKTDRDIEILAHVRQILIRIAYARPIGVTKIVIADVKEMLNGREEHRLDGDPG